MKVAVHITLKNGVLDPQGVAIGMTLQQLGFSGVRGVRVGKLIELDLDAATAEEAHAQAQRMCDTLLTNPVIETAAVKVES